MVPFVLSSLTLLVLQTKRDTFANSVDPNETGRNEPSHQTLQCLTFFFFFFVFLLFFFVTGNPICNSEHV